MCACVCLRFCLALCVRLIDYILQLISIKILWILCAAQTTAATAKLCIPMTISQRIINSITCFIVREITTSVYKIVPHGKLNNTHFSLSLFFFCGFLSLFHFVVRSSISLSFVWFKFALNLSLNCADKYSTKLQFTYEEKEISVFWQNCN